MNINVKVMIAIFIFLSIVVLILRGSQGLIAGFKESFHTISNVWILLILALIIAGMLQVLIPGEMISEHLGQNSGLKGILIGWGVGAVMPGAPYTVLPISASLLKAGSGIGPVMTMILSASIGVALTRIPYEIAFLGWRFTVLRIFSCFLVPIIGGVLAGFLARWANLLPLSIPE